MTTFRVDLVAATAALLVTYQVANPTLLRQVNTRRPAGIGETPCAWIGDRNETDTHSSQVHRRTFALEIAVADQWVDDSDAIVRMDTLIDGLVTLLSDNPRAIASCLIENTAVTDTQWEYGTVVYPGAVITVRGIIQEGRE